MVLSLTTNCIQTLTTQYNGSNDKREKGTYHFISTRNEVDVVGDHNDTLALEESIDATVEDVSGHSLVHGTQTII